MNLKRANFINFTTLTRRIWPDLLQLNTYNHVYSLMWLRVVTWDPMSWYMELTTLSNRLMSSFWLKSSSCLAGWSANIVISAGIELLMGDTRETSTTAAPGYSNYGTTETTQNTHISTHRQTHTVIRPKALPSLHTYVYTHKQNFSFHIYNIPIYITVYLFFN